MVRNIRQTQTCVRQQGRVSALVQRGKTASKLTLRDSGNSRAGICQEDEKGGLINMKRIKLSKGNTFRIAQIFLQIASISCPGISFLAQCFNPSPLNLGIIWKWLWNTTCPAALWLLISTLNP